MGWVATDIRDPPFRRLKILLIGCLGILPSACNAPVPTSGPVLGSPDGSHATNDLPTDTDGITVHIASDGWHSAIILARGDLPPDAIPEAADFPHARFLAFGWGDAEYYPSPEPTFMMTLYAGLIPSPAVVHVIGLARHPREAYPSAEIIALKVSSVNFRRLSAYLHDTFDREGAARARPSAPGRDPDSLFYRATGTFHMFNTCNSWTAGAVRAAGWRVEAAGTLVAEDLMAQLRKLAPQSSPSAKGFSR